MACLGSATHGSQVKALFVTERRGSAVMVGFGAFGCAAVLRVWAVFGSRGGVRNVEVGSVPARYRTAVMESLGKSDRVPL